MRLAVFDCDGTLVDSCAHIVRAMHEAFARLRLPAPPPEAVRRVVGLSLPQAMEVLAPRGDASLHRALAEAYRAAFRELRHSGALQPEPLYPGMRELLDALRAAGWALAIATGKSDRGLALLLDRLGLAGHFVARHTADRHPSKPHPAMLQACLADTGVAAEAAVVVGDTAFDMAMAAAAGVRAIGVAWGYHAPAELEAAGAVAVARDAQHLEVLLG
ncbi:MAG: HAD-IA family hydrolase [Sphingomonadaceae bacterium]|uniref:HAD-IA family hydrolase n=1 Tax=Thermaurantiacus sp. TaxID=2820283 RepID=UPI00298F3393|nr:HAD-IA family hydrolase [Thermaurantiacus sp.]MCS6987311.1 HAD-IA family hydrolase [Sphingomonadaceae bacterium]MDW8414532.1 HAD-IA family hydrolase [Thermaurantiacus sp.]